MKVGQEDRRETVFFCELYGETGIAVIGEDLREKFIAVCTKSYKELRGERQPFANNTTAKGRAENRRVDIEVSSTRTTQ